ncbi:hypothetical protein Ga0074812_101465 [Parafrankia irregularis]|uniref:Uncharacterized protein n=2 Tax=Frankiaceae TaxID=74712 RepID=A0A0S4QGW9_9ACTN|nr:hypothetical protein Ga0074812_101465 [Parafrankia irregularis]
MLRGLVGGGRSRLSLSAAMRARDVAQLTDADLAWAEATVVLRHAYPAPPRPEPGPGPGAEPGAGPAQGPGAVTDPGGARGRPTTPPGDQTEASRRAASPPNVHPRPPGTTDGRGRGTRPRPGSARPGAGRGGQDAGAAGDASGSSPERS